MRMVLASLANKQFMVFMIANTSTLQLAVLVTQWVCPAAFENPAPLVDFISYCFEDVHNGYGVSCRGWILSV